MCRSAATGAACWIWATGPTGRTAFRLSMSRSRRTKTVKPERTGGGGPAMILATWFGCGLAPFAPGTFGSLGALVPAILLARAGWRPLYFVALAVAALPLAVWSADRTAKRVGKKDPQLGVVDEVVGQWIALGGAASLARGPGWVGGFAPFRGVGIWE